MGEVIRTTGIMGLLTMLLVSNSVLADDADVFNLSARASYSHDSNLFRLDRGVASPVPGKTSRSDNIYGLTAGLSLNKPISLQRFKLNASVSSNTFANYDYLDNNTLQYNGAWNWHVTPRISGILSLTRNEALNGFDNYRTFTGQNMRTTLTDRFEADIWVKSNWHGLVGLVHDKLNNSQLFEQESNSRSLGWNVGARYDTGTGRTLTLRYIQRDGDYTDRPVDLVNNFDDAFTQRDYELTLAYPLNDKTRIDGVIGYVDRSHPHISARDFDGLRGQLGLDWKMAGKVGLKAEVRRRVESWQDSQSSYSITNGISVGPQWLITAKQRLDARIEYDKRQYEGPLPLTVGPLREDSLGALVLNWG